MDYGRQLDAEAVSKEICHGAIGPKKVIQLFSRDIGYKPGKAWIFFEEEARPAWQKHLRSIKGRSRR